MSLAGVPWKSLDGDEWESVYDNHVYSKPHIALSETKEIYSCAT